AGFNRGREMFRKIASLILPFASILVAALSVPAQSPTTGSIAGRVVGPNGGAVAGAEVSVRSLATAEERVGTTDDEGNYLVPLLTPGKYRLIVRVPGLAVTFVETQVFLTESTRIDMTLEPAGVDTVTINLDPIVQLDGPARGRVVDTRAVSELPQAT